MTSPGTAIPPLECEWDAQLGATVHRFPPGRRECACGARQVAPAARRPTPGWYGKGVGKCAESFREELE